MPSTDHAERLSAPPSWWAAAVGFAATCGWIVLVIGSTPVALTVALLVLALCLTLVLRYGLTVTVDAEGLRAGPAHLPAAFVGPAEPLHRADYRARLGVDADARAHLVTRPYLDRGVLVQVADPADPTPYWLISSRHPDELADAINTRRTTHEGTTRGQEV